MILLVDSEDPDQTAQMPVHGVTYDLVRYISVKGFQDPFVHNQLIS